MAHRKDPQGQGRYPRRAVLLGLFCVVALSAIAALPGEALAKRVALVIGNSTYGQPRLALKNPVNDADLLSEKLSGLGFEVILLKDAERAQMNQALDRFQQAMDGAEMSLFFYAGHGVQAGGENFLVASDFAEASPAGLERASLSLSTVQLAFGVAGPKLGMIVLDACRDNPFATEGGSRAGLARSTGAAGLMIAYATDPGNVAYDGAGDNSAFTAALVQHMDTPGLDVRLMLGRVRQEVIYQTDGAQIPWVEEAILGEHSFRAAEPDALPEPEVARDLRHWEKLGHGSDRAAYEAYLAAFPEGLFREVALARIETLDRREGQSETVAQAVDLQGGDIARVRTALALLGYLPGDAGSQEDVARAVSAYAERIRAPQGNFDPDRLFLDAAETLVLLGANTAQQLRTDMVALKSIDRALVIARDAYRDLRALAAADPSLVPIVREAAGDLDVIERRRAEVLAQLDAGRTYYEQLLDRGRRNFAPEMSRALSGRAATARSGGSESKLFDDARDFVRHVRETPPAEREGSYAWLADFLP